ncbi:MAG: isochorismatase family protein [Beijerinckiaceae bacterium]
MAAIEDFENHCWKDAVSDADMKLYAHYRRETKVGPDAAFLAIDLYNAVYRGGPHSPYELNETYQNSCGIFAHNAIAPTKKLFAAVRAAGLPVFYCTQDIREHSRPAGAWSTHRKMPRLDEELFGIYHEFAPHPEDVVIRKQRASAFSGTPLLSHLNLLGIKSLIVCGESTSGCVRASVVDAYSAGFHVSLVEECTYDRSALIHKINLFDMGHKYADVMHVEEVLAHLGKLTKRDAA